MKKYIDKLPLLLEISQFISLNKLLFFYIILYNKNQISKVKMHWNQMQKYVGRLARLFPMWWNTAELVVYKWQQGWISTMESTYTIWKCLFVVFQLSLLFEGVIFHFWSWIYCRFCTCVIHHNGHFQFFINNFYFLF